ncbi:Na(+)/citrate cotransporter-like [Haemaphysalis longicornis]
MRLPASPAVLVRPSNCSARFGSPLTPDTLVLLLSLSLLSLPAQPGAPLSPPILPWAAAKSRVPWSCIALAACGEVHSAFFVRSGLDDELIAWVQHTSSQSSGVFISVLALLSAATAELTSQSKGNSFLLHALDVIVREQKVNPLKLMLPVSRLASAPFSISTSSQNNALLREYGGMSAVDMISFGGQLHIVFTLLELASIQTVGKAMFELDSFPYWALSNATGTTERA